VTASPIILTNTILSNGSMAVLAGDPYRQVTSSTYYGFDNLQVAIVSANNSPVTLNQSAGNLSFASSGDSPNGAVSSDYGDPNGDETTGGGTIQGLANGDMAIVTWGNQNHNYDLQVLDGSLGTVAAPVVLSSDLQGTNPIQGNPSAVIASNGSEFVVAWNTDDITGLQYQRFSLTGTALDSVQTVKDPTANNPNFNNTNSGFANSLAIDSQGDIILGFGAEDIYHSGYFQEYNSSGTLIGSSTGGLTGSASIKNQEQAPFFAPLAGGGFVTVGYTPSGTYNNTSATWSGSFTLNVQEISATGAVSTVATVAGLSGAAETRTAGAPQLLSNGDIAFQEDAGQAGDQGANEWDLFDPSTNTLTRAALSITPGASNATLTPYASDFYANYVPPPVANLSGNGFSTLSVNSANQLVASGLDVTAIVVNPPVITGLTSATDSGTQGDNRTDDATPAISGTSDANATITIYLDGSSSALGTTTADGSGNWTYDFGSALSLTAHSVTATATASSTTSSASTAYDFTIDAAPVVSSIDRVGASPNNASSDAWTVTFSQSVSGVTVADFSTALTGTAGDTGLSLSGSGAAYTVTANGVTGDGTLGLNLKANSTGITDASGDAVTAGKTGQTYTIQLTAPVVTTSHISVSGGTGTGGAFKIGDTVTAMWDDSASGDDNSDTINAGGVTMNFSAFGGSSAVTATNSGGVWTGTYVITAGNIDTTAAHVAVTATDFVGNATTTSSAAVTVDDEQPVVTTNAPNVTFTGGGAATTLDSGITVSDVGGSALSGATVAISSGFQAGDTLGFVNANGITGSYDAGTGVLTLSGSATISDYQAALASVTYGFTPANGDPTAGGSDASRAISWSVTDGVASSAPATSSVSVVHAQPTIFAGSPSVTFTGGGAAVTLDSAIAVSDPDSGGDLSGATVAISGGFQAGDTLGFVNANGITGSYDAGTGVLTLSGSATISDYQAALASVTYGFNPANGDPTAGGSDASRAISWSVTDGVASSAPATSSLAVVHAQPTVPVGSPSVTFTGGGAAVTLDSAIAVSDPDSGGDLSGATVAISGGFQAGDTLGFVNANGITGSYDAGTGMLTLSGSATIADYQAALASVTYGFNPANGDPTAGGSDASRAISWSVTDGVASSALATTSVSVVHAPPTVFAGSPSVTFTGGGAAVTLDSAIAVSDPDSGGDLSGATVAISGGFQAGDTLGFVNANGITGSYDAGTGVLTLSGSATISDYQAALASVTYGFNPANGDPTAGGSDASRAISWSVTDGVASSAPTTSSLAEVPPAASVTLVFNPNVSISGPVITLTGTASPPPGISVVRVELFAGTTDLGPATLNGDGSWSFALDANTGSYNDIVAVATDNLGRQTTAPSDFDLNTAVRRQPFATELANYDSAGNLLGLTFFKRSGAVYLQDSYAALPNGDSAYTYTAGSFFRGKAYASFTDTYDASGSLVTHVENNSDGSHYIEIDGDNQTVRAIAADTFANYGSNTHFVFDHGVGAETIYGFQAAGAGHDTVNLPAPSAFWLTQILDHARGDGQGDATINIGHGDTITFVGVSVRQLENHAGDFRFHT
jgi:hypothetical protein